MRTMHANCVAFGGITSRRKGGESAMTAEQVLHFKDNSFKCGTAGHKERDCPRRKRTSGGTMPSIGSSSSRVIWCSKHNSHLHDNLECRIQLKRRGKNGHSNSWNYHNNGGNEQYQGHRGR